MILSGPKCFDSFSDTHHLFAGLADRTLRDLRAISSQRNIAEGEYIGRAGNVMEGIYLFTDGAARMTSLDENGNQTYLASWAQGEIHGLFSVMNEAPDMHFVQALTPMNVAVLPAAAFRQIVYSDRYLCEKIIKLICDWLKYFCELSNRFAMMKPIERLAYCLADIALGNFTAIAATPKKVEIRISQYELSAMLALSRQCVNLYLKRLEAMGLLAVGYKVITIIDLPKLRHTKSWDA